MGEIAAAAGLSRGTPGYFFGSKEELYLEVLDRAFARRQSATAQALEPLRAWCEGDGDLAALAGALRYAVGGYVGFLSSHPGFVALVMQEELAGGRRLQGRTGHSTAMKDAFGALRRVAPQRGVGAFEVDEAVLLFVALTFAPASYRHTLMRTLKRSRRARIELAVAQLMYLVSG